MRKKLIVIIPPIIIAIAIVAIIISFYSGTSVHQNALTSADIVLPDSSDQENLSTFDKSLVDNNIIDKFLFKDFEGGCIYSLNHKIFLLTENSDAEKVHCYLGCATQEKYTPIAITKTGNYLILQTEQGEKIAVQTRQYQMDEIIEPTEPIAFDDLPEKEKNSLFELTEE